MSAIDSRRIETLTQELQRAYDKKIIPYFHVGKFSTMELEGVDVYIGLFSKHMAFEEIIKAHIRKKYSDIVRAVLVEMYTH
jgi:hypothetical protein